MMRGLRACGGMLLAVAVLAAEWRLTAPPLQPPPPADLPQAPEAPLAAADLTQSYVITALARPLFSPSRRPPAATPAQPGASNVTPPPRLSGILMAAGEQRAIFQDGETSLVGGIGGSVGPYRIVAIGPAQVTLLGPGGVATVRLAYGRPVEAAPPPSVIDRLNSGTPAPAVAVPRPPTAAEILSRLPVLRNGHG